MDTRTLLTDLVLQMEWADALVWSTVLAQPRLADDAAIRDRLHHIHLVQRAFLHIWRREPFAFSECMNLRGEALAAWGRACHTALQAYVASLQGPALDSAVTFPAEARIQERFGATAGIPTVAETAVQVTYHSAYHRGQVAARIREIGFDPPLTDYVAWLWLHKPPAPWPAAIAIPS